MRPGPVADELLEEPGGDARPSPLRADVLQVGHGALERLSEFREHRQFPEAFADLKSGLRQVVGRRDRVAEEAGGLLPERGHAGAGQGSEVDDL